MIAANINLTEFDPFKQNQDKKTDFLEPSDIEGTHNSVFSLDNSEFSLQDSGTFILKMQRGKETLLNDHWEINENIQARILSIDANKVYAECVVDPVNNLIQTRKFPFDLFRKLPHIKEGKPVLIQTRSKPGAVRIEVYPGEGIVRMDIFKIHDKWESLRGENLSTKLREW